MAVRLSRGWNWDCHRWACVWERRSQYKSPSTFVQSLILVRDLGLSVSLADVSQSLGDLAEEQRLLGCFLSVYWFDPWTPLDMGIWSRPVNNSWASHRTTFMSQWFHIAMSSGSWFFLCGFFFFLGLSNIWLSYRINAIVKMRFWKVNSGILTRMTAVHMRVCTSYRFLR